MRCCFRDVEQVEEDNLSGSEECVGDEAEGEAAATSYMCFLGEKYDGMPQLPHCISGRLFHAPLLRCCSELQKNSPNRFGVADPV